MLWRARSSGQFLSHGWLYHLVCPERNQNLIKLSIPNSLFFFPSAWSLVTRIFTSQVSWYIWDWRIPPVNGWCCIMFGVFVFSFFFHAMIIQIQVIVTGSANFYFFLSRSREAFFQATNVVYTRFTLMLLTLDLILPKELLFKTEVFVQAISY